jgi:RNA polymerase sigma factor (sigma-70 family)
MGTVSSAAAPANAPGGSARLSRVSDEVLARQATRGSERAFTALYERYHQQLYRYCRSIVRNDSDAQDVLQSTFTAALLALRRDQRTAPLRPWLYRIAHNEAITLLRRQGRESDQELSESALQVAPSAADQAADRARWSALVSDLAGLPDRQRSALVMRELSGLSHEEIAVVLGTGVGGAKQAIFEARQALAELAEGRAMECDEVRRRLSAGDRRVLRGRRVGAHLRDCRGCEAFAAEISARRAELRAFTPALPAAAAAAVLSRSLGAAATHVGSGAAAGSAAATAGAVGKAAGTAVIWKAATGVAVLATAAAGVSGLEHVLRHHHAAGPPAGRAAHPHGAAVTAKRAGSSVSVVRPGASAAGTTHPGRAGVASRAGGPGHSSSVAAELASSAAGHGKPSTSHGSGNAAAGSHKGRAGKVAPHSRSAARPHAPATHGPAPGHRAASSGTRHTGTTHTSTTAHVKSKTSPRRFGAPATVTTPGNRPPHAAGT